MDTPKSQKLEIVIPAYRMHSQLFHNAMQGISEEDALKRIDNKTNHLIWMVGNLVNCRFWVGNLLGIEEKDPFEDLFKEGRALDENLKYPSLEELMKNFAEISPKTYHKLLEASDGDLEKKFEFSMEIPFIKPTVLNMIGMCIGREDYLLGQIGLMRKLLDLKRNKPRF